MRKKEKEALDKLYLHLLNTEQTYRNDDGNDRYTEGFADACEENKSVMENLLKSTGYKIPELKWNEEAHWYTLEDQE